MLLPRKKILDMCCTRAESACLLARCCWGCWSVVAVAGVENGANCVESGGLVPLNPAPPTGCCCDNLFVVDTGDEDVRLIG